RPRETRLGEAQLGARWANAKRSSIDELWRGALATLPRSDWFDLLDYEVDVTFWILVIFEMSAYASIL
ncbi:MAG: hypothetical protein AAGC73_10465, partial [Verrucomicrobiota bacterium]